NGLFGKAIVESGSSLRVSTREQAGMRAKALLEKFGLSASRVDDLQKKRRREALRCRRIGFGRRSRG
ncbi:MAG TPA: hypothetical protein VNY05_45405, partial [Candidatus Acidoferrales bacterium]|nr:hypothetical protein [Candidatus Acidoferrales bacterium]